MTVLCFFAAVFRRIPECPLLILANREESRTRASEPPKLHTDGTQTAWLGGRDLQAGGTWLGVNRFGLVAAITNRRKRDSNGVGRPVLNREARSRGLLCRDCLQCRTLDDAVQAAQRQLQQFSYEGFNLLLLTREQVVFMEGGNELCTTTLRPGIHVITNGRVNDPADERIVRALHEFETLDPQAHRIERWFSELMRVASLPAGEEAPAICLTGPQWGTVSSTVIALTDDPGQAHYYYASGPPSETAYEDVSPLFRQLLTMNSDDDKL